MNWDRGEDEFRDASDEVDSSSSKLFMVGAALGFVAGGLLAVSISRRWPAIWASIARSAEGLTVGSANGRELQVAQGEGERADFVARTGG